jgi:hypothetical protein
MNARRAKVAAALVSFVLASALAASAATPCRIEVVEQGSGWPVPLVELKTTHHLVLHSDNAGVVAVDQPDLLGREVFLHVAADGYEVSPDGFGYRGVRLQLESGTTRRIEVRRTMVARRLGRLTGAGLFAESQATGQDLDWKESGVFGCDSVQTVVFRGRRHWLWGDTTLPHYPLGIFDSLGAFSTERPFDRFEPPIRPTFDFVRDERGRLRGITPMPGEGPTWATALVVLPDRDGTPHLVCSYTKVRGHLESYEWGLAEWNDSKRMFERRKVLWTKSAESPRPPELPVGHAVPWKDDAGRDWILFSHPFPTLKCPATYEAWMDPARWTVVESQKALKSAADGSAVRPHDGVHSGGIGWHPWRRRWVTVFLQAGGKPSALGELWYAEADAPTGPWGPAVKVLTHRHHTFYNPCLHLDFTPADAPVVLFEGTYTREFSSDPVATPRHDYNQILYRLDLDDPRLRPAHPVVTP